VSRDLISKKTRTEFREYLVGWTLREIRDEFDIGDLAPNLAHQPDMPGERRGLVEQYYHAIDFTRQSDVDKLLQVYEAILVTAEGVASRSQGTTGEPQFENIFANLCQWLRRDGYEFKEGRLVAPGRRSGLSESLHEAARDFDAAHLQEHIQRIEAAVETDPALAIGSAKELLETCCKTILEERGKLPAEALEFPKLTKLTFAELKLLPENVPDAARGAQSIKQLLSNLSTVSHALAEIRNLYGTGHGRSGKTKGLGRRHARLAVGAATTLATFLIDTHKER
jgi:hypothetical protein